MKATEKQVGMLSFTIRDFPNVLVDRIEDGVNMKRIYLEKWAGEQDSYDISALITIIRDNDLDHDLRHTFLEQYLIQKKFIQ